ncbi:MAG: hypothetical protein V4727_06375 [Verrucomicrobiota bacterium]
MKTLDTVSEKKYQDFQQRVAKRTMEIAKLDGRAAHQIKQADYEQAKREVRAHLLYSVG